MLGNERELEVSRRRRCACNQLLCARQGTLFAIMCCFTNIVSGGVACFVREVTNGQVNDEVNEIERVTKRSHTSGDNGG